MRKLHVIMTILLTLALCVGAMAVLAEGGVCLEYALTNPEVSDEERALLFAHWEAFLRGRLLEQGVEEVRVSALEDGAGIRVEVPGAADPDTLAAWIGEPPVLSFRYEDGTEFLTGRNLESVDSGYDENWESFYVALQLDAEGAEIFAEATGKSIGRRISVWLDDEILMEATVQDAIYGGNIAISGLTQERAEELAGKILAGAEAHRWALVGTGTLQTAP